MSGCPECGFDYATTEPVAARALLVAGTEEIADLVLSAGDRVGRRPADGVWSALEYACHVRDVLLAQRERVLLSLAEDDPSFAPIYRDQRVSHARYASENPSRIAAQLSVATELFVWVFDGLDERELARPCIYNYPEPTQRDVGWLMVHTAHEVAHHARDVRAALVASPE